MVNSPPRRCAPFPAFGVHRSAFTVRRSAFGGQGNGVYTSYLSPLTSHLSPLTSHLSPLTSHLSPLTSHLSPLPSPLRHPLPKNSLLRLKLPFPGAAYLLYEEEIGGLISDQSKIG
jgi:hypothetical protein